MRSQMPELENSEFKGFFRFVGSNAPQKIDEKESKLCM